MPQRVDHFSFRARKLQIIAISALIFGLSLTAFLSLLSRNGHRQDIIQLTQTHAETVAHHVSLQIREEMQSLQSLANYWFSSDIEMNPSLKRTSARAYANRRPWFGHVKWINASHTLEWAEPPLSSENKIDIDLDTNPAFRPALHTARARGITSVSKVTPLISSQSQAFTGETGMVIIAPILINDEVQGFIGTGVSLNTLFSHLVSDSTQQKYHFTLIQDGDMVFEFGPPRDQRFNFSREDVFLSHLNATLSVQPSQAFTRSFVPYDQILIWIGGVGLTATIIGLLAATSLAQKNSRALSKTIKSLRTSEERYDLAVEGLSVGIWEWHYKEDCIQLSSYARQILNLPPHSSTLSTQHFLEWAHYEDRPRLKRTLRAHAQINQPLDIELRFPKKNGEVIWCHMTGASKRDENGRLLRTVGSIADVSPIKKAQLELKKNESRFRAVSETLSDGIFFLDPQGYILFTNPTCERLLDSKPFDLQGRHISNFFPQQLSTPNEERQKPYFSPELIQKIQSTSIHYAHRKDEAKKPVRLELSQIKTIAEHIFILNVKDISLQIAADEERENFISTLEKTISELEQFTYAASHDLREPLRMIGTFSQLLSSKISTKINDEEKKYLDVCTKSANQMKSLLDDLITLSQSGESNSPFVNVDPEVIINNAIKNLAEPSIIRNAEINIHDLPENLNANPVRFIRLFQNLISNAIKYRQDGIQLRIEIFSEPYQMGWLFHVKDNGIGMKPEYCQQIFEPFKRLHNQSRYPGSGLGLAICRKIVTSMGGEIWANSAPNQGSHFYIYWPSYPTSEKLLKDSPHGSQ